MHVGALVPSTRSGIEYAFATPARIVDACLARRLMVEAALFVGVADHLPTTEKGFARAILAYVVDA